MPLPHRREIRRLTVVTGDHGASDPTKKGAAYGAEDLAVHDAMVAALRGLGRFEVAVLSDHRQLFAELSANPPDLVLNFCDTGVGNQPSRELNLPAWLELHDIPYTGAPPQAMVMCFDKQVVRLVADALSVPVPAEFFLSADAGERALPGLYPALLKPNAADGSVGITQHAVVRDAADARDYLAFLARELPGRDVLWQEYLPGPEYGVGLIGNPDTELLVLPTLEVDFSKLPAGLDPILSFESKTDPDSPYWTDIGFGPARLDPSRDAQLQQWTKRLFRRFGLRDYGRFDFRCAADGGPRLMEVNPNPAWANDAKLAFMAGFAGLSYPQMLERLIDAAIARVARSEASAS